MQHDIGTPLAKIVQRVNAHDYAAAAAWAQLLANRLRALAAEQPVSLDEIREAGL